MTRAQQGSWKRYCSEPLDKIEHYEEALAEGFKGWCIHHRLEIKPDGTRVSVKELIDQNLYYGRPASELVFMRKGEHCALHNTGNAYMKWHKHSADTRRKISEAKRGKQLSAETRKKLSEAHKDKQLSAETRQKMSEAHKGKHPSEESRKKMSEAHKGKPTCMKGKHHSEETRLKISSALKGKSLSAETCKKMSEARKGNHWYNNGVKCIKAKTCPEGFVPGRLQMRKE